VRATFSENCLQLPSYLRTGVDCASGLCEFRPCAQQLQKWRYCCMKNRSLPVPISVPWLAVLTLTCFLASCDRGPMDPWLSPSQVDVQGQCAIFTGRILVPSWADRQIETTHGMRYQVTTGAPRIPPKVSIVVVEALEPGLCRQPVNYRQIADTDDSDLISAKPTFTVTQSGSSSLGPLEIRSVQLGSASFNSIRPEKKWPWPLWPWSKMRNDIFLYTLDLAAPDPQARAISVQACLGSSCSTMMWPK